MYSINVTIVYSIHFLDIHLSNISTFLLYNFTNVTIDYKNSPIHVIIVIMLYI